MTDTQTDDEAKKADPAVIGTRAPNAQVRPAAKAADIKPPADGKKDYHGMPEGYEPDTSVTYVAGTDDKAAHTVDQEGNETAVNPHNSQLRSNVNMENLEPNHTYRDRVEAQAKDLGIEIDPAWTLEYLMWTIRMRASA